MSDSPRDKISRALTSALFDLVGRGCSDKEIRFAVETALREFVRGDASVSVLVGSGGETTGSVLLLVRIGTGRVTVSVPDNR